jgi:hypothetical protein
MTATEATCPMTAADALEAYFLEHRGKLLDIAAFLDRIDRTADGPSVCDDHRLAALREGLRLVADGGPDRARRLLEAMSDPTTEPIPEAHTKSASGAHDPDGSGP